MALETPWPICQACRNVPFSLFHRHDSNQPPTQSISHFLQPSFKILKESASKGCHACTLFYEAVREPFKSRLETAPIYLESVLEQSKACSVVVSADLTRILSPGTSSEVSLREANSQPNAKSFQHTPIADVKFTLRREDIPEMAKNYKGTRSLSVLRNHKLTCEIGLISLFEDDPGAVKYIRQSLDQCLANHKGSCDMVQFPHSSATTRTGSSTDIVFGKNGLSVAPTRLVDVGSDDPKEPARVVPGKLCLRDGRNYFALSYCNGATPRRPPWHYTSVTMAQFEDEIPLEALPQTLHDAVKWIRKLGERFVWIDCLCILQDSAEDWEKEASRMASIYGSALLTLVAASGSVYGGMTDRRNPLRNSAVALNLPDGPSSGTADYVFILPHGQSRDTPAPAPTDSRGWCFQEDILSPRIIKFTLKEVKWDCVGNKSTPPTRPQALEALAKHPSFRRYTLWYRFIEWYSNKELTFETDKLPAFSGIAANKTASKYLAGVLEDDVWAGLLWCRDDSQRQHRPGRRYGSYVAPSWSWASLDVPIRFHEAHNRHWRKPQLEPTIHDPQLRGAATAPSTFNPLGAVKAGHIELTAYCAMAITTTENPNVFCADRTENLPGRQRLRSISNSTIIGELVYDVLAETKENIPVQCALLHVSSVHDWTETGVAGIGVAFTAQISNTGRPNYRRLGYVQYCAAFRKACHRVRLSII